MDQGTRTTRPSPGQPTTRTDPAQNATLPSRYWDRDRGLIVASLALVFALPAVLFGIGAYAFLGPMLLPGLVALILVLATKRAWTFIVVAILGSLFPLFAIVMFGILSGQATNPLLAPEYTANLVLVFALVLLYAGAVGGYRRARSRSTAQGPRRPHLQGQSLVVVLAAAVVIGAIATSYAAENHAVERMGGGYDFTPAVNQAVHVQEFAFNPQTVTVTQGTITEILVQNEDRESHTLTYEKDGRTYDHFLPRETTVGFLVLFEETGQVKFWCTPHSDGAADDGTGMVGQFEIVAG